MYLKKQRQKLFVEMDEFLASDPTGWKQNHTYVHHLEIY